MFGRNDADLDENEAFVTAECADEENILIRPFDATLSSIITWRFFDQNDRNHFLTVTAELTYKSPTFDLVYTIYTKQH